MEHVQVSAEAAAVIDEELIRRMVPADGRYDCWRCAQPGDTNTPTSAVVLVYANGYKELNWAHARCVPSMLVQPRGRLLVGAVVTGVDDVLRVRAAVLDQGPGGLRWPVLLHEFQVVGIVPGYPAGYSDLVQVVEDGLALVTEGEAVLPAVGWRLELRGSRARLTAGDGTIYYAGRWDAPGGWEELARERAGCLLVSGIVGLFRWRATPSSGRRLARELSRAARAGTVAGGIVPVARA
jgi:hypothetical protein